MKEKIIQFGEGGFLRGFFDWMLAEINEKTDFDGKAVVVQPIKEGLCDTLTAQGCKYTHLCRGVEGVDRTEIKTRVMGVNHFTWFTEAKYRNIDLFEVWEEFLAKYEKEGVTDGKDDG